MVSINFIARPNNVSHSIKASSKSFDHLKDGFALGNKNLPRRNARGDLRELTIANVANQVPLVSQPSTEKEAVGGWNHVTWTSVRQHRWEGELGVEGEIPLWLNGIYLRNGLGLWHVGDYNFGHLFDGYAMVVKLQFENGRLITGHRLIESEACNATMKHNKLIYQEFSEFPKADNFLSYISKLAGLIPGASLTDNANTGVIKLGDGQVICPTKTQKGSIMIDPTTLETLGKFEYTDSVGDLLQSTHPIATDTEFLTVLPDLINPRYTVARMEGGSSERKVIGRVECQGGPTSSWVHSFAITKHYIVAPEMPSRCNVKSILKAEPSPLYAFEWHPESKGCVHVMCKASGKIASFLYLSRFISCNTMLKSAVDAIT